MGHKKCGILIDFDDVATKFATMTTLSTTTSTCVHHIFCRCLEFFPDSGIRRRFESEVGPGRGGVGCRADGGSSGQRGKRRRVLKKQSLETCSWAFIQKRDRPLSYDTYSSPFKHLPPTHPPTYTHPHAHTHLLTCTSTHALYHAHTIPTYIYFVIAFVLEL